MNLDYRGLRCPQPILKLTIQARQIAAGTTVEVLADCPDFPNDLKKYCERHGKVLLACTDTGGGAFKAQVQF